MKSLFDVYDERIERKKTKTTMSYACLLATDDINVMSRYLLSNLNFLFIHILSTMLLLAARTLKEEA